jgi:amino acid adenylation domain-containing protein
MAGDAPPSSATEVESSIDVSIHELLEEQALRTPQAIAVEFEGRSLSYGELHARANQLAHLLRGKGVGPEVLVGICVERSLEMVVALLGVLKAGGGYVPLDPSYGSGRIKYVIEHARVKTLITQKTLLPILASSNAEVVCLDSGWSSIAQASADPLVAGCTSSNVAYVIYTSGSTGKPKGVVVEHRSVANFLSSMRQKPGLHADDVLVAVTTISFDIAGLEIFLPLLVGARLVVASRQSTQDGNLLLQLLHGSCATVLQATPATWRLLFECDWKGSRNLKVLVGGEALSPELAHRLASTCGEVWNMYGPTETTIWSSICHVNGLEQRNVPIGKPIANTTFYILDGNLQPVSSGTEGELYIGGDGLARGYFEQPDLTAEKFVPDPFSHRPGARMYRTGDLARFRPDGNAEFLGRLDQQVKIRGFRIELGEVEVVLEQHPSVLQAVAVAREEASGDKSLIAYLIPTMGSQITIVGLREHLLRQLPEYMIPSAFLQLAEFPLTPNGKLDRKNLPAPTRADYQTDRVYVAPRNDVERELAALWEKALGVHPVGAKDNFFDLGGSSLRAARLFTDISRTFGSELPLTTLVHAPTLELLANEIRHAAKLTRYPTLVTLKKGGSKPPFFIVHGGAGSTLFLRRLASRIDDHPVYGIEPDGLDGRPFRYRTVEQLAAYYLSEIRKVQPAGPYFLGGYCFGGLVAFEMAQQVLGHGEDTAALVLLTAPWRYGRRPSSPPARPAATSKRPFLGRLARLFFSPWLTLGKRGFVMWLVHAPKVYRLLFALGQKIPQEMRQNYVLRTLNSAERLYVPKPFPGALIFLRGSNLTEFGPNLGWDGLAESFEHRLIGHSNYDSRRELFNEPLVEQTARELNAFLERASDNALAVRELRTKIEDESVGVEIEKSI